MPTLVIEGGNPLQGTVTVPGAKNSAIKLIYAAMFSNDDVILDNVPHTGSIEAELENVRSVGGKAEWAGANRLILNGSSITTFEVPQEVGCRLRTTILLGAPLMFRFGQAKLPKFYSEYITAKPINRLLETWQTLGVKVEESKYFYHLDATSVAQARINFKTVSHMGTDNAILSSLFCDGETVITNASEESEVDDLVAFVNLIGGDVRRTEPRVLVVKGSKIFRGGSFEVQPDKTEAATYATAALLTGGNLVINGINRNVMVPYVNFLNKLGAKFELGEKELKVWRHGEVFNPVNLSISPTPGFVADWQSLACMLLTQAVGVSTIHNTIYINHFGYTKNLNMMGADIELIKPSEAGFVAVTSDDSYDFEQQGEPYTVAKINGPTKFQSKKIVVDDITFGPTLVLAALCAEGKSELRGAESVEYYSEKFFDKLVSLGAKIWRTQE